MRSDFHLDQHEDRENVYFISLNFTLKKFWGLHLAWLVSWTRATCHVSLPLSLILFPVAPSAVLSMNPIKAKKICKKKKNVVEA